MERDKGGNPLPTLASRPRHHVTAPIVRSPPPYPPGGIGALHLSPPLSPSSSLPLCHVPLLRLRSTAAEPPMPMRAAPNYIIGRTRHTPHLSALALFSSSRLASRPSSPRDIRLRPAPPLLRLLRRRKDPTNPRASPSPPPFLPEVPALPLPALFIPPACRQRRSLCRRRPSGARQIRAPHADLRHPR